MTLFSNVKEKESFQETFYGVVTCEVCKSENPNGTMSEDGFIYRDCASPIDILFKRVTVKSLIENIK
ncbi:hypothetical protein [Vibrio hyugaensis]|uniref:hypothetical protein n=1 Tax=Vibrio hyugaensis TaxID=1534743 RepID=UPI000CE3EE95|nr:hypothetical protein [Vibrio hyugaensis]